ncbi:hypothetical protein C8J57DRAFT_1347549, partial [Mycena rebaudengoi]
VCLSFPHFFFSFVRLFYTSLCAPSTLLLCTLSHRIAHGSSGPPMTGVPSAAPAARLASFLFPVLSFCSSFFAPSAVRSWKAGLADATPPQ